MDSNKGNSHNVEIFKKAFNYYEGNEVKKDYHKAFSLFKDLALQNDPYAKLLVIVMSCFGHGTNKHDYTISEINEAVNSVNDPKFLFDISQKMFNRDFFEDDFRKAYADDKAMEEQGFPEDFICNVTNLEFDISYIVKTLSIASAVQGYTPAQNFVDGRIVWMHL